MTRAQWGEAGTSVLAGLRESPISLHSPTRRLRANSLYVASSPSVGVRMRPRPVVLTGVLVPHAAPQTLRGRLPPAAGHLPLSLPSAVTILLGGIWESSGCHLAPDSHLPPMAASIHNSLSQSTAWCLPRTKKEFRPQRGAGGGQGRAWARPRSVQPGGLSQAPPEPRSTCPAR